MVFEPSTSRPATSVSSADPFRVMVVDDSAVVRGLITRMLEEDTGFSVVASVGNGQMAVSALDRHDVEVVILDIEMPVMDGLTALPKLLKIDPELQVIMASTLTLKNADVSLRALEAGAADYIPKPTSSREISGGQDFKHELIGKVRALGMARRRMSRRGPRPGVSVSTSTPVPAAARVPAPLYPHSGPLTLRPVPTEAPDVIAIGSSTGGPQALFSVLGAIKVGSLRQPILITQHMPPTFTTILAEHISRISGWAAAEGKDGEIIQGNRIYIAPGDFHMVVETRGTDKVIRLNKNPPENFCRPSVDPMLRSIASAWGRRVLTVILTGMGSDGLKGGQVVVGAGGTVIAQDEASSVVWGMPGAVATAGICSAVLPLPEVSQYILRLASRR
ncbi:chemotaxis response regulator protein-glutamate methylesterase [Telmatospirillum sp.]|uniref:protein-glutamate methylesterase/protein-glutamine glutaminase n=1 Tax=Telmatospirillum sp. TaxID=2079197 RepID=UPI00284C0708|nr:chemotaxis response regulator protein-glutamate methylesterase [Telmatospirillum sp.]MDR3440766.1 chemotaxis response regulator protein-glutamate methylesterase [Telmatospirillum sp.]